MRQTGNHHSQKVCFGVTSSVCACPSFLEPAHTTLVVHISHYLSGQSEINCQVTNQMQQSQLWYQYYCVNAEFVTYISIKSFFAMWYFYFFNTNLLFLAFRQPFASFVLIRLQSFLVVFYLNFGKNPHRDADKTNEYQDRKNRGTEIR